MFIFARLFVCPTTTFSEENTTNTDSKEAQPPKSNISYSEPLEYDIEYIFELYPDLNNLDKSKHLKLWIPVPRDFASQKNVHILSVEPKPYSKYTLTLHKY
jgi:hypothetical protein